MRRFGVLLLLVLVFSASLPVAAQSWATNLQTALKTAAKANKLVLVDFTATWCGWCKKMETDVFNKADFRSYVKTRYQLVRLDADKYKAIVNKYQVTGFPTVLVLSPKGAEVQRIVGYLKLKEFMKRLKSGE